MLTAPLIALARRGCSLLSHRSRPTFPALSLSHRSLSPKSLSQTLNLCRRCDCGCDEAVGSAVAGCQRLEPRRYTSNPYAEFNIFRDPFAAYQVFHSGIPITLVPLDTTNTIPITAKFFSDFERRRDTFERARSLPVIENGSRYLDGYTMEVTGAEGVRVLVASKAKPNRNFESNLDRKFFVLNLSQQCGSSGDFLALIYLLKVPVEVIDLKGILISATGWANAATIDVVYDILHMMGRDDIPVGRGEVFAIGRANPSFHHCWHRKYIKAIPHGVGGFRTRYTLWTCSKFASKPPGKYTAENSVKYGAPRDNDHPELRQPLAFEVWQSISKLMKPGSKITMLTSGPLSNLPQIILKDKNASSLIEVFYFQNFLLCPISSSLLSSLASIDWKSFGLNVKSSAIDEDGDAVLEWENLPPLVHISHCKAAPDLIYGCVPPLLLSLLS
ncbi:hypothetical protein Scep_027550 [Stephania cephalantha]|uniref:Inosine/uridine-preferring nucleoside hydrolase domain-containing protein n=1 Tax=Stephania cephalantha TaxID=152367 RepID=A0AAP0HHC5_9MAGN